MVIALLVDGMYLKKHATHQTLSHHALQNLIIRGGAHSCMTALLSCLCVPICAWYDLFRKFYLNAISGCNIYRYNQL